MEAIAKHSKKETKVNVTMSFVDYLALRDLAGQIRWRKVCEPKFTDEHDRIAREITKINIIFN